MCNEFGYDQRLFYEPCSTYIEHEMLKLRDDFPEKLKDSDRIQMIKIVIEKADQFISGYLEVFESTEAKAFLDDRIKITWNYRIFEIEKSFSAFISHLISTRFNQYDFEKMIQTIVRFYLYLADKCKFDKVYEESFARLFISNRNCYEEFDCQVIAAIRKVNSDFMHNYETYKEALQSSNVISDEYKQY